MDYTTILKTLKNSRTYILLTSLKTTDELDKKLICLVNAISKEIDIFSPKARLCLRLASRFDKECKDIQINVRKLKKIWKKEKTEES